ncbi:MAG TPA: WhiB family transcriptional regulator [Pseudonocardia sp.]|jgi:WhiB family redox-sensing transcriptional regulator|nr:WhiB family transcriptional regulator [Pseudonocardia sp.]
MRGLPEQLIQTPCRTADPDLWFAERPAQLNEARALCANCPIRQACLEGALQRLEPWGVWGGEIVHEGVVLAYKRGRGRPSNSDRALGLVTRIADHRRQDPAVEMVSTCGRSRQPRSA